MTYIINFLTKNAITTFISFLLVFICYYLIYKLAIKINIKDYIYDGCYKGKDLKIRWLKSGNVISTEMITGKKIRNDFYYFDVYLKYPKEGINLVIDIDIENKLTYDREVVVVFNKKLLTIYDRIKLLSWIIKEFLRLKISRSIDGKLNNKKLPNFLIEKYVFTDSLLENVMCKLI